MFPLNWVLVLLFLDSGSPLRYGRNDGQLIPQFDEAYPAIAFNDGRILRKKVISGWK